MEQAQEQNNSTDLKRKREDYIKTFSSEEGKRVLNDLSKVCHYNISTFSENNNVMAFQEGLRAVFLHIRTIMNMDIEELERLINASSQGR